MDDRRETGNTAQGKDGGGDYQGYETPGADQIVESTSSAVPSPSVPSEERLTTPKPVIESIGETPGDANPALVETVGAAQGQVSTADMLRAREGAEEQNLRAADASIYQDEGGSTFTRMEQADSGRPNWPDDRREAPLEYMTSPRADAAVMSGDAAIGDHNLRARVDATIDRDSTHASAQESRSGLPPVGLHEEEDKYEEREFGRPQPPSDLEMTGGAMVNLPPEDRDDE